MPALEAQANEAMRQRATEALGITLEPPRNNRVVLLNWSQTSAFGDTEETRRALSAGRTGVRRFEVPNAAVQIGAPLPKDYEPLEAFPRKDQRRLTKISAMAVLDAMEAGKKAEILNTDGTLKKGIDRLRVGSLVSSGYCSSQNIIDIWQQLHKFIITDKNGRKRDLGYKDTKTRADWERVAKNSQFIKLFKSLSTFPEQMNARIASYLGISGVGQNSSEACATGLANPADAFDAIRQGELDFAFAGGYEELLDIHTDVTFGVFNSFGALSTRNDEPEKASRPWTANRDGFVIGSGGAVAVLANRDMAIRMGLPFSIEITGANKSMDGGDSITDMDPENVARTLLKANYSQLWRRFFLPEIIFAHATSTPVGDIGEKNAMTIAYGEEFLQKTPITAIKSMLGHQLGGAGASTLVAAANAIKHKEIPPTINYDNPDPEIKDALNIVQDEPLMQPSKTATGQAFGFGGYNAAIALADAEYAEETAKELGVAA